LAGTLGQNFSILNASFECGKNSTGLSDTLDEAKAEKGEVIVGFHLLAVAALVASLSRGAPAPAGRCQW
jgi:hypothetical protein